MAEPNGNLLRGTVAGNRLKLFHERAEAVTLNEAESKEIVDP